MNNPTIHVTSLDGRYAGSYQFKYRVEISRPRFINSKTWRMHNFNKLRDWCVDAWGKSCERNTYITLCNLSQQDKDALGVDLNPSWAWHVTENEMFIYLVSDKELSWMNLTWL